MKKYTRIAFFVTAFTWCSVSALIAGDKFSGHAWFSNFEACMEETKAPLVFHDGQAYLYNRFHASLRHIGPYKIEGDVAELHIYRGIKTSISCSIQDDGKLAMTVSEITKNMGYESFANREKMPWILKEIKDEKLINRAIKLIEKEKEPNQQSDGAKPYPRLKQSEDKNTQTSP